jgi:uncharacterized lipoprotein YajG
MKAYILSRREFLAQLGLATAGTMLAACAAPAARSQRELPQLPQRRQSPIVRFDRA